MKTGLVVIRTFVSVDIRPFRVLFLFVEVISCGPFLRSDSVGDGPGCRMSVPCGDGGGVINSRLQRKELAS
jgi:hypothetical protein